MGKQREVGSTVFAALTVFSKFIVGASLLIHIGLKNNSEDMFSDGPLVPWIGLGMVLILFRGIAKEFNKEEE